MDTQVFWWPLWKKYWIIWGLYFHQKENICLQAFNTASREKLLWSICQKCLFWQEKLFGIGQEVSRITFQSYFKMFQESVSRNLPQWDGILSTLKYYIVVFQYYTYSSCPIFQIFHHPNTSFSHFQSHT